MTSLPGTKNGTCQNKRTGEARHAITINSRGNSYPLKDKLKTGLIRTEEPATIN